MNSPLNEDDKIKAFLQTNKEDFEQRLLVEAVHVREKIEEILLVGNVDLLNNAHKVIQFIVDQNEEAIISFAQQEGEVWATHSLTLSFKLEWIQAIRRTLWNFLYEYEQLQDAFNDEIGRAHV